MKKLLIVVSLMMISPTADAAWHIHAEDGCAILTRFMAKDDYFFCGMHDVRCHGDRAENSEIKNGHVKWFNHKDPQTLNNNRYWCCDGRVTYKPKDKKETAQGTPGKWVKGPDFYVKTEPKTISVSGGTCTYTETTDICGYKTDDKDIVCKSQIAENITCPEGQFFRASSKKCAKLCESGYAFESATSNLCVECAETATQGIISDIPNASASEAVEQAHAVCLRCTASNSVFNASTRTCEPKPKMTALSTLELQYGQNARTRKSKLSDQCWTKYGNEYKKCVFGIE